MWPRRVEQLSASQGALLLSHSVATVGLLEMANGHQVVGLLFSGFTGHLAALFHDLGYL